MPKHRLPQYLTFKGMVCEDENLRIMARMVVRTTNRTDQQVGPLLNLLVPWTVVYDSDLGEALNTMHARLVRDRQHLEEARRLETQEPLF